MGTRATVGRAAARAALAGVLLAAAGCGSPTELANGDPKQQPSSSTGPDGATGSPTTGSAVPSEDMTVEAPKELTAPLLSSDVLVYSQKTLDRETIANIGRLRGVTHVETFSMGSFYVDEQQVTYAAADPRTFWRLTPPGTAHTKAVWDRVAGGEIAVEPTLGRRLQQEDGFLRIGNEEGAQRVHIGAYAQLLDPAYARRIDAVVNEKWIDRLGMPTDNAMIVSMGSRSPQSIRKDLQRYAGTKASVQILGPDLDIKATQTAILTGGSVAAAVGSFSYRANPDGTVVPDQSWVSRNIVTQEMPIIGRVTGHRVMLPQLRAALNEIVTRGLSSKIKTFDGCYVPRFIARDPSRGLSFHSFGTAIDLNAATNYRGIPGDMDRTVVAIFKRWGFAWGGDWNYTDPMHFELARLVDAR